MSASRAIAAVVVITALNLQARHSAGRTPPSRGIPVRRNQSLRINPTCPRFCCGRFAHASDGKIAPAEPVYRSFILVH
jgi:hypothetical protein